ncbi:MAG: hypothetical protein HY644_02725 [Acidobacteria bacterium]|nr:hypothetical protein [Acidobacteriota bacterium]
MVVRGRVQNGVVVLEDGVKLPDGTRVTVAPIDELDAKSTSPPAEIMSEQDHRWLIEALDRIASLPIEGPDDGFSGADHDRILYGKT